MIDDLEPRYVAEMIAHANVPVHLEVTLSHLGTIVAGLQLALRHPNMPLTCRAEIEGFLWQAIAVIRVAYPAIAEGLERGNDARWDLPRDGFRQRPRRERDE